MLERTILVNVGGSVNERTMTCGVPQGSVLGPTMWNIFYDGLLRIALPDGASLFGFADDVALIVVDHTTEEIERVTNDALNRIDGWIRDNGLKLAHGKTEVIMLTRKWAYRKPIIFSGGLPVEVKRKARYFGVVLDTKRTFVPHLKMVSGAAVKAAKAVGRLMPNTGGPSWAKRRLLASVVSNRLLYAALVWSIQATKYDANRVALLRDQRIVAIRIARCYRTVSAAAAFILADTPPGNLLARERGKIRVNRTDGPNRPQVSAAMACEARDATLVEWQARWTEETEVARWTRRVLLSIKRWIERPSGAPISFHLAQALTGQGAFGEYLHRFALLDSPRCPHCDAETDDAKHTIFDCPQWTQEKAHVIQLVGRWLQPEDVQRRLCGPVSDGTAMTLPPGFHGTRGAFLEMVEAIMAGKEAAERARQQVARASRTAGRRGGSRRL